MAKEDSYAGTETEAAAISTKRARCCWRLTGLCFGRHLMAHARKPYFLFAVGTLFTVVSIVSLHYRSVPYVASVELQGGTIKRTLTLAMIAEQYPEESCIHVYTDGSATNAVTDGGAGVYINSPDGHTITTGIPTGTAAQIHWIDSVIAKGQHWLQFHNLSEPRGRQVGEFIQTANRSVSHVLTTPDIDLMEQHLRNMQQKVKVGNFRMKPAMESSSDVRFQYRDLAVTQAQRRQMVRAVCDVKKLQEEKGARRGESLYHEGWYGRKFLYAVMEVYRPQNLFFCPVLKVGSTFFRRLFYALSNGKAISSPYDIPIHQALAARKEHLKDIGGWVQSARGKNRQLLSLEDLHLRSPREQHISMTPKDDQLVRDFLQGAGKVMFTREPYAKLLSGYVDKLFAPNPYFWSTVGRFAIQRFRPNASPKSLACGHDVTFSEFVQYVIENEKKNNLHRDTHFVPSYDQCKPCDVDYDVIGKMETFGADVSLLLSQLGHNLSQSTLDVWSRESEFDAISDSIVSPYSWRRDVTKCMTWEEANKRIWRKLQIRGILHRNQSLPLLSFRQYSSNSKAFIQLVKSYWEKFRGSGFKKLQQRDAFSSAYSVIRREDLELVREYFMLDFDMFQYDSRPAVVFRAKQTWDIFDLNS